MAQKYGKSAKSTYEMANKRRKQSILILALGLLAVIVIYLLITNQKTLGLSSGAVTVLVLALLILPDFVKGKSRKKDKEERRAIRGAKAEEKVEGLLDGLGERYVVLHDITSPYGNIDHLVIGRESGIFLLETKAHGGRVEIVDGALKVNGHDPEKNFIAQCLRNTYWLREQVEEVTGVKPWVTPLLVFTNAFVKGSPTLKGVRVLNKKYLLPTIQGKQRQGGARAVWEKREEIVRLLNGGKERNAECAEKAAPNPQGVLTRGGANAKPQRV